MPSVGGWENSRKCRQKQSRSWVKTSVAVAKHVMFPCLTNAASSHKHHFLHLSLCCMKGKLQKCHPVPLSMQDILYFQSCFCWNGKWQRLQPLAPLCECSGGHCRNNRQVNWRVSIQMASVRGWSRQIAHNTFRGEGLHLLSNRNFFLSTPWCGLMLSGHPISLLIRREDTKINIPRSS